MKKERTAAITMPRLVQWRSEFDGPLGIFDYLSMRGGPTLALAFAELFWPRFVEIRGCVLLKERYEASNFETWWEKLSGHTHEIEAMINHIHLWDLFDLDEEAVPEAAMEELVEVIGLCWGCALRHTYPGRRFDVVVSTDESEYGPTVTFKSVG